MALCIWTSYVGGWGPLSYNEYIIAWTHMGSRIFMDGFTNNKKVSIEASFSRFYLSSAITWKYNQIILIQKESAEKCPGALSGVAEKSLRKSIRPMLLAGGKIPAEIILWMEMEIPLFVRLWVRSIRLCCFNLTILLKTRMNMTSGELLYYYILLGGMVYDNGPYFISWVIFFVKSESAK